MSNDPILKKEPILEFIADRGYISGNAMTGQLHQAGVIGQISDPEFSHILNTYIQKWVASIPEGPYLAAVLTHLPFINPQNYTGDIAATPNLVFPSEAYLPAPGAADAIGLTPASDSPEMMELPPACRRTAAWIVTQPRTALVVLTYDPGILPTLIGVVPLWLEQARRRRPDLYEQLCDSSKHVLGFTSPHQLFTRSPRWRQMPVATHLRELLEPEGLDPFLETEIAVYCWNDFGRPLTSRQLKELQNLTHRRIILRDRLYPSQIPERITPPMPPETTLSKPVQNYWRRFFVDLVTNCAEEGDSDIHLLPKSDGGYSLHRRRSGHLSFAGNIPQSAASEYLAAALAGSRIELGLSPSLAKDGRVTMPLPRLGRVIDLRIAISPGAPPYTTPAVVFRLLDPSTVRGGLDQILFSDFDRQAWEYALSCERGLILVTGPTGTGKSRTLYAFLQSLHKRNPSRGYKSIEEPIELRIGDWLQQNQVDYQGGSSFALLIRSLLRADPEVIFIGEIRDAETAAQAVTGARSGHLVIASLHTNTPADVPARLQDLGVHPSDIRNLLRFASAQTLLGRSCPNCRSVIPVPPELRVHLGDDAPTDLTAFSNAGCTHCFDNGVRGRFAAQEYLLVREDDHELIRAIGEADATVITSLQRQRGFHSLRRRCAEFAVGPDAITNVQEALTL